MTIYKFPGSAIEANTITELQLAKAVNDKANNAYAQANAAYAQANTGGGTAGGFRQSFLMSGL